MSQIPPADLEDFLADLYDEPTEEERTGFRVDSDEKASWAFRKLRGFEDERQRLQEQADVERARIDAWLSDVTRGLDRQIETFSGWLRAYYEERLAADPSTPKTYRVLGGEIQRRKNPDRVEITNPAKLVAWAQENQPELVTVHEPEVQRSVLKGQVGRGMRLLSDEPSALLVVEETGEVVPGCEYVRGDERIVPKVTR